MGRRPRSLAYVILASSSHQGTASFLRAKIFLAIPHGGGEILEKLRTRIIPGTAVRYLSFSNLFSQLCKYAMVHGWALRLDTTSRPFFLSCSSSCQSKINGVIGVYFNLSRSGPLGRLQASSFQFSFSGGYVLSTRGGETSAPVCFFVSSNNRAAAIAHTAWWLECHFGIHTSLVFGEDGVRNSRRRMMLKRVYVYLVKAILDRSKLIHGRRGVWTCETCVQRIVRSITCSHVDLSLGGEHINAILYIID